MILAQTLALAVLIASPLALAAQVEGEQGGEQNAPLTQGQIENEIIVMGDRLRSVQADVSQDGEGRWHCSLSASSGSDRIDSRMCKAITKCVQENGADHELVSRCLSEERRNILRKFRERLEGQQG